MSEDAIERVTSRMLYDEIQKLRAEIVAKFDNLDDRFVSRDAHDELARRIDKLEHTTVPIAVHNIETCRVKELETALATNDKLTQQLRGGLILGGILVTALTPLVTLILQHWITGGW